MTTCMLMLCYFGDLPSSPPMVVALCVMYVIYVSIGILIALVVKNPPMEWFFRS
jgi:hypothetical protein